MPIAIIPLLVMVAGLLLYALATNTKVSNIGMWMFIVGLFWLCAVAARFKVIQL